MRQAVSRDSGITSASEGEIRHATAGTRAPAAKKEATHCRAVRERSEYFAPAAAAEANCLTILSREDTSAVEGAQRFMQARCAERGTCRGDGSVIHAVSDDSLQHVDRR